MTLMRWFADDPLDSHVPMRYAPPDYHHALRHMDRQMGELQRSMDHAFNHAQRHFGMTPMDFRLAEADNILNPVVAGKDGERKLQYKLDVRQFKPEEISIKTKDGRLEVHAKHEENTEEGRVYREYHRTCALPRDMDPQTLKSQLGSGGVLLIEAPLPKAIEEKPQEHIIPITHESSKK